MKFKEGITTLEKVSSLQRYILVQSCLYYEMDSSVITDKEYDKSAYGLVEMQKEVNIPDTDYGSVFIGFDGTTGFDLFSKLDETEKEKIRRISKNTLKSYSDSVVVSTKK
jgi:NAD-dependent DNA ligase